MGTISIRLAKSTDLERIAPYDTHIRKQELESSIASERVILAEEGERLIGWLRWNLFWDNTPFMNLLFLLESDRNQGYGTAMVSYWENQMKEEGYPFLMTSTQSDEEAQHFYRKLGYVDSGALLFPGQALEIIFIKNIDEAK